MPHCPKATQSKMNKPKKLIAINTYNVNKKNGDIIFSYNENISITKDCSKKVSFKEPHITLFVQTVFNYDGMSGIMINHYNNNDSWPYHEIYQYEETD